MTKKQYCLENGPVAGYAMGLCGIDIHGVEYGIDDYVYSSTVGMGEKTFHRSKIYYPVNGSPFFYVGRIRVPLNECCIF